MIGYTLRRSEIWFFGAMLIMLCIVLPLSIIFLNVEELKYLNFWWVVYLPYVPIRTFFRNSKLSKWLETEVIIFKIKK